jgi:uncharacterized Zn finger protein
MSWGWGWDYERTRRRPANGIKAQSRKFGQTWWAGRWLAALERLVDSGRLSRGRSYARSGQVLNIDIGTGRVDARVQGSHVTPYEVSIEITTLSDRAWKKVADAMAAQAIFAAKLLAREMPQDIEEAFAAAGVSLFPAEHGDLVTYCTCPDWANPCKHVSAVYYLLGEQFDADPFLLFRLRGKSREDVVALLRARRSSPRPKAGAAAAPAHDESIEAGARKPASRRARDASSREVLPLQECLDRFWDAPTSLEDFQVTIKAPAVDGVPVKRLGQPGFWHNPKVDLLAVFTNLYRHVTERSLSTAMSDKDE